MKFCLSFFIVFMACLTLNAQSYRELVSKAETAYQSKEYKKSAELYKKAFTIETKSGTDFYNAACSEALAGNKQQAYDYLDRAIKNGWTNLQHFKTDSDLNTLHDTKRWDELVAQLQKKVDVLEANYDKKLQQELLEILKDDQGIRQLFMEAAKVHGYQHPKVDSLGKIMQHSDSVNLKKITKILDERGWVGKDLVGPQANQTLFLVIQHADYDTQKKYLPMMREAVKKGNANSSALALLEDRVAIREGKKQIYGSQIGIKPGTNQHYVLPLLDPANVDKRRAEMGLGPIADYIKNWDLKWDVTEYEKMLPEYEEWAKQQGH